MATDPTSPGASTSTAYAALNDSKSKEEKAKMLKDLNKNFATVLTTALGMVAALSWRDSINTLFTPTGIFGKISKFGVFAVSVAITIIAFFGTQVVTRVFPST